MDKNAERILMDAVYGYRNLTKQDLMNAITSALGIDKVNVTTSIVDNIPKVNVLDESGEVWCRGFYFRYPAITPYPLGGNENLKYVEGVVTYMSGDWGLPCYPEMEIVTPPRKIVLAN